MGISAEWSQQLHQCSLDYLPFWELLGDQGLGEYPDQIRTATTVGDQGSAMAGWGERAASLTCT